METYVDLAICDRCGDQGSHGCQQLRDRLVVHQVTYRGQPAQILTLPGDEPVSMRGVLMRLDPPTCSLTAWS